jgi:DNA-binding MurR/RpiR family transcriptional regulator
MGILLNRLLIMLNDSDLDSIEYHIAYTLLMNFHSIYQLSIQQVADLCSVSKSKISKFIRDMHFEDYADFRAAAQVHNNKYVFNLNYNQNIVKYIEDRGMDAYIQNIHHDIEDCRLSLDMKKIEKLAEYLIQYKKAAAFGLLFSELAAVDLQTKLAYSGKFIITNMSDVKQDELINNAHDDLLIIIFSNSGNYMKQYQLSEFQDSKNIFKSKAKIVLITSNKAMESDPRIDLCLTFNHLSKVQTHSFIYPLINDYITMKYRELSAK